MHGLLKLITVKFVIMHFSPSLTTSTVMKNTRQVLQYKLVKFSDYYYTPKLFIYKKLIDQAIFSSIHFIYFIFSFLISIDSIFSFLMLISIIVIFVSFVLKVLMLSLWPMMGFWQNHQMLFCFYFFIFVIFILILIFLILMNVVICLIYHRVHVLYYDLLFCFFGWSTVFINWLSLLFSYSGCIV